MMQCNTLLILTNIAQLSESPIHPPAAAPFSKRFIQTIPLTGMLRGLCLEDLIGTSIYINL